MDVKDAMAAEVFCKNRPGRDAQADGNPASEVTCGPSATQGVDPAAKLLEGRAAV